MIALKALSVDLQFRGPREYYWTDLTLGLRMLWFDLSDLQRLVYRNQNTVRLASTSSP